MKYLFILFIACSGISCLSDQTSEGVQQSAEIVVDQNKLIYENKFNKQIDSSWSSKKGSWKINAGSLRGQEPQGNDHPVHLKFIPKLDGDFKLEFEMKLASGNALAGVMLNPVKGYGVKGHLGRAILNGRQFIVRKDGSKIAGSYKKLKLKQALVNQWLRVKIECKGRQLTASFNDQEVSVEHEYFQKSRGKTLYLMAGETVSYRNLKVYGSILQ